MPGDAGTGATGSPAGRAAARRVVPGELGLLRRALAGDRQVVAASAWSCANSSGGESARVRVVGLLAVEPTHHAIEDRQQVAAGWRGEQRERQAGVGLGEHAVGDEQVKVHVQVDQVSIWTTLALNHGDLVNAVQAAQNGALIAVGDITVPEGDPGALSICRLLEQRGILLPAK
jgi:hypothetical protein